jgi:predicted RNA-binding protein with RPS1 domain
LDVDTVSKHIKLSIKAIKPKVRYKTNYSKPKVLAEHSDFTPLGSRLNDWINEQLKEKRNND